MEILETKIIATKDIVIGKCLSRPIEQIKDNEEIKNLSDSMEEIGQLHPCFVRIVNGKPELIAGGRRYLALCQKDSKIEVKIVKATDLEAMELGLIENIHRKDPDINQRDRRIYYVWKFGLKSGVYKHPADLAKKLSWNVERLGVIIFAGKEKEMLEYKNNVIIQNATSRDLVRTKLLSEFSEVREKILVMGQRKDISSKEIAKISKKIKVAIDKGVNEKIVAKAIDLVSDTPKNISIEKSTTNDTETPTGDKISVEFKPNILVEVLDVLRISPVDIQKKIVDRKITVEDAKIVNEFKTKEARDQIIKENEIIDKQKDISVKLAKEDKKRNIELRKKQQDGMEKEGDTKIRTEFDIKHERKLRLEETYEDRHELVFIERYQKLMQDTGTVLSTYHPRKMKTKEGKKDVSRIIKSIYELYHDVLVEIGEIKGVEIVKRI